MDSQPRNAPPLRCVVLISGRGTNLATLLQRQAEGRLSTNIAAVISNRPDAPGLEIARGAGCEAVVLDHTQYASRASHEEALMAALERIAPELIILAGYMRILGDDLVTHFLGRMINLHPSLLPLYPGLHTHQAALDNGDAVHGASVHFVTPALDAGPVIAQARMPVRADDTAQQLAARLLPAEHRLLAATTELFCQRRVEYRNGAVWLDGQVLQKPLQLVEGTDVLQSP